jgi:DNA-binding NtrC family response regulator
MIENTVNVLSVSANEDDHASLQRLFCHSNWRLEKAPDVLAARASLQTGNVSVVVCDDDTTPGVWIDILNQVRRMSSPPSLIVTSRLADNRRWAEALRLGAWDILPKPFDRSEVFRSVKCAWDHWHRQTSMAVQPTKSLTASLQAN